MCARSARANAERRKRAIGSAGTFVRCNRQPFETIIEIRLVDLDEIAAVESIDPGLDLHPQGLELQRILSPALLQDTDGVANRLAGILVFARLDTVSTNASCSRVRLMLQVGIAESPHFMIRIPPMAKIAKVNSSMLIDRSSTRLIREVP